MSDYDPIACTCCKKSPKKKFWAMSKIKYEVFGSTGEFRLCPECQKYLPKDWYSRLNSSFHEYRDYLVASITAQLCALPSEKRK